ncbi:hypothetical protein TYRP_022436 [Tyrophagus putrescentiae]|nr:hypothetical protein TYRP_022436 [Tyrophagus putrescentiae]
MKLGHQPRQKGRWYFASSFEATFEGGFGSVEAEGVAAGPLEPTQQTILRLEPTQQTILRETTQQTLLRVR